LGVSESKAGYILGAYSLAALVSRPFSGYAFDYIGRKKVYLTALGIFTLISALYPLAYTFALLVLFRFLHGLCFGFTSTGGGTIVADLLPPTRRGEGVGYFGLAYTFSMALGPALGLWIMGDDNYLKLFIISGLIIALSFALANLVKFPTHIKPTKRPTLTSFFEKRVVPVSMIMLLTGIASGGIMSYIIIYSKEIGIINGGLYFFVNAIGVAITRLFSGRMMDKYGPKSLVIYGIIIWASGFFVLAASKELILFLIAAALIGVGSGIVMPVCQTMIINVVEPECRGVANSTYYAALDIGIGGGSIVLGLMTSFISLKNIFFLCGLFYTVPLVLFLVFVIKDYERKVKLLHTKTAFEKNIIPEKVLEC
ncbi:MAG: MFS transporter, partial [Peptococcales bacterium]